MLESIKSLDENINVINKINNNQFKALLTAIFDRYNGNGSIFSEQEENNLNDLFQINEKEKLKQIIDGLVHIVKQIIFNGAKFKSLLPQLTNLGLSEDKAIIITKVWSNFANEKIKHFKDKCYNLSDCQLKDVNWKMRMQCKQSNSSNLLVVKAQVDLILNQNKNKDEVISLEFDHNQLSYFYKELEKVQDAIDTRILQL